MATAGLERQLSDEGKELVRVAMKTKRYARAHPAAVLDNDNDDTQPPPPPPGVEQDEQAAAVVPPLGTTAANVPTGITR